MKLVDKIDQNRRDFKGKYECQGCGHVQTDSRLNSYDDDFFHDNVIPKMQCESCGESTETLGVQRAANKALGKIHGFKS